MKSARESDRPLERQRDLEHVPVAVLEVGDRQAEPELHGRTAVERGEIRARERPALRGEALEVRQLAEADARGDVGQVVLAAEHVSPCRRSRCA
jgi:hypothetical protein